MAFRLQTGVSVPEEAIQGHLLPSSFNFRYKLTPAAAAAVASIITKTALH